MKTVCLSAVVCLCVSISTSSFAQAPAFPPATPELDLGYQTGTVTLGDNLATIRLPDAFRFIGPDGSRRLLTDGWGNPPAAADGVLGMLVPASVSPLADEGWGIVITYDEQGYVDDEEAGSLDYDGLLKQMREESEDANSERQKQGFPTVTLVGWAEPPSYDARTHKLYWAKELAFSDNPGRTLNYSIRVLGRRGVLVLNAVASMDQLPVIKSQTPQVLAAVDFNQGNRYADYVPGTDKVAEYGLTGLIVGAAAMKGGLFKLLWASVLAFKKAILLGIVALVGLVRRFLKSRAEVVPPPLPPVQPQS